MVILSIFDLCHEYYVKIMRYNETIILIKSQNYKIRIRSYEIKCLDYKIKSYNYETKSYKL